MTKRFTGSFPRLQSCRVVSLFPVGKDPEFSHVWAACLNTFTAMARLTHLVPTVPVELLSVRKFVLIIVQGRRDQGRKRSRGILLLQVTVCIGIRRLVVNCGRAEDARTCRQLGKFSKSSQVTSSHFKSERAVHVLGAGRGQGLERGQRGRAGQEAGDAHEDQ